MANFSQIALRLINQYGSICEIENKERLDFDPESGEYDYKIVKIETAFINKSNVYKIEIKDDLFQKKTSFGIIIPYNSSLKESSTINIRNENFKITSKKDIMDKDKAVISILELEKV